MASVNVGGMPLAPDDVEEGPRMIRVKKGAQPTHSTLNPLQRWAWRTFRNRVTKLPPTRRSRRTSSRPTCGSGPTSTWPTSTA